MKYVVSENCKHLIVINYSIDDKEIGFVEIYRNGTIYTDIQFNGDIKLLRKILRIANIERIKNNIKYLFRKQRYPLKQTN